MMKYNDFIKITDDVNEKSKISKKELIKRNKKLTLKLKQINKERILKQMNKNVAGFSFWDNNT